MKLRAAVLALALVLTAACSGANPVAAHTPPADAPRTDAMPAMGSGH
jgi:hypothetical protein